MPRRETQRELEKKRDELREKGKADSVGRPYETRRDVVEEGDREREGTNLDIGEERSADQERDMERWRRD